ncbi:hypothetical protein SGUI_0901 [Serinicoccus hydrothermalis]|uniref:Ribonuclease VapC n=1 Tax=Serinicoccus hydrothermalis TaxID=1758689 RepID=A0A1B1NA36_9MICO|nr:type II toxin-antitoxin system VapC family toxin [Serinicoccus hydrothermalis]ANS78297.1 hypothetical protein SGUI_0901 [Serinicoccus hydrothermalis]
MIVLDASVLIGDLDGDDAHHGAALALLTRESADTFAVDVLTHAEILVAPTRVGRGEDVELLMQDLQIETLPLPVESAGALADLRVTTALRMPDCCVAISAQQHRARLATFDRGLGRVARKLGIEVVS